ncbi:hypothetical protein P389DRAFT_211571 [Cystobasidium minutum MCA 4210]|uniref:uncharacterized protein n=1 Tax=Cystobasidium minutum MCA 4210 TaxID=1397322 RepID=UPI0034CE2451|eukprot:jgi/Rhomi1/211571/estExt_Genemark1.C_5_t10097
MHDAFQVSPEPVVSGLQDRVESLLLYAGRLFIGCQNGSLHIYTLELASESTNGKPSAHKERVIQSFSKKSIEQLGVIKETNTLVSLSNGSVYLHDIHTFEQQMVLGSNSLTKAQANLFALDTSIQSSGDALSSTSAAAKGKAKAEATPAPTPSRRKGGKNARDAIQEDNKVGPVVVTTLAVACRRRLCLFHWRDGQWQEPKELSLPHQVRSIAFPLPHSLFLGYSTSEYGTALLPYIREMDTKEGPRLSESFASPSPSQSGLASSSGSSASHTLGAIPGLGTLGGLAAKTGGYMGIGGKVDKNIVAKVKSNEVLVLKDNTGMLLDDNGALSRKETLEYALPPEETVVSWPYILSILPAPVVLGQLSKQQALDPLTALPSVHVHSALTLAPVQAIRVPPLVAPPQRPVSILDVPPTPTPQSARLLTAASGNKPLMALVTNAAVESSSSSNAALQENKIYLLTSKSWTEQIDQLIAVGEYSEALALLRSLDNAEFAIPGAVDLAKRLRMLVGLSLFLDKKKYDAAVDIFIEENVNPAKVVALFPIEISGKLHCEREEIEEIWGGRTREHRKAQALSSEASRKPLERRSTAAITMSGSTSDQGDATAENLSNSPSQQSSWRFSPMKRRETSKDDDAVSVRSLASKRSQLGIGGGSKLKDSASVRQGTAASVDEEGKEDLSFDRSVDVLMRYLPDRRQQFLHALASLPPHSRPTPSSPIQDGSGGNTPADLFALPDAPLSSYSVGNLQRVARVVETALFKCYLHAKPGLLGPLCRIENWCEVEEVEELLLEAKKYRELLDLYNGKQMHEKALKLLRRMADDVPASESVEDKVEPIVTYVQKLGPDHLDLIFSASEWVFSLSASAGLEIFIADREEVERLPRHAVSNHLSKVAPREQYAKYLEHIIHHLNENGPEFHERLIEIYMDRIKQSPSNKDATKVEEDKEEAPIAKEENYQKLLRFLETSKQYRPDRLLARIGDDERMEEVKATLLGKLGQHDGALQIYVHKLKDHARAEEYCKRVYEEESSIAKKSNIFVTLLNVYLRPRHEEGKADPKPQLEPALHLLAKYGARMDANYVLEILPPLLTVQELQIFLSKSIRKSISWSNNHKVVKRIRTARMDQVNLSLVELENRRVKITDGRLCPQCHKRLGNSVIAIHSPLGEVTHYQCREKWIESKRYKHQVKVQ